MAVRGSLRRRSSLENRMRGSSALLSARQSPQNTRPDGQEEPNEDAVRIDVLVNERDKERDDAVVKEKEKDSNRGVGQGGSEQATSNTDVTSQHQPKLRRDPSARTRHIRLRQRQPGHPGRYSQACLPLSGLRTL